MPRPSKGPRLYLRAGRKDSKTGKELPAIYFIRDGAREISTRCTHDDVSGAEQQLQQYLAAKWRPDTEAVKAQSHGGSDLDQVSVAEVLALYVKEKVPTLSVPADTKHRVTTLANWWGLRTLAEVRRSTCMEYCTFRTSQAVRTYKDPSDPNARKVSSAAARRELEDLSAAIGYWDGEHPMKVRPKVWLPDRIPTNREALTRSEAAALLWAAMGHRKGSDGKWRSLDKSTRSNRMHLRRFLLLSIYTGTRAGVIPKLLWDENPVQPWVDIASGMVYRRGKAEKDHKNKKRPVVKLPKRLLAHMRRWKRLDDDATAAAKARGELFARTVIHHGGSSLTKRVRRSFASCIADAGLNPDITPHWLRHTSATWLMERGVTIWDAAAYTGMSVKILESTYGHHRPDYQQSAASKIA